jgi:hypothetical protein
MSAKILYPPNFGEGDEITMYDRGNFEAIVEADSKKYKLLFRAIYHIAQDLRVYQTTGRPYFAKPGLVIVEDVNVETIEKAVVKLYTDGYFDSLMPMSG